VFFVQAEHCIIFSRWNAYLYKPSY